MQIYTGFCASSKKFGKKQILDRKLVEKITFKTNH